MAVIPFDFPYSKTPCYTHTARLYVWWNGSYCLSKYCGNRNFRPFWLLLPWPWPDDFHTCTGPVERGDMPQVQIWTLCVKAFESYRLTDRQTDMTKNYRPRRFSGGQKLYTNIHNESRNKVRVYLNDAHICTRYVNAKLSVVVVVVVVVATINCEICRYVRSCIVLVT